MLVTKVKARSTFNNRLYSKSARSLENFNPSNKLSRMDEKLSVLNSDIEELYKKYIQKKKLRRRKEKSEQSLVTRINFLIDEERKIRNQIENKVMKNQRCSKNWSVRSLRVPDIISHYGGNISYLTIESSEESARPMKNSINNSKYGRKINYISNLNRVERGNDSESKIKKFAEIIKKNGLGDLTLSSIQNNSSIDNNITIGTRPNVTNNVCIIINNSDKLNSKNEINNKNISFQDMSFAEKDSTFNDKFINDKYINTNDNVKEKKGNNKSSVYFNIQENENNYKINNEINFIKMRLASKLEENINSISKSYQEKNDKKKNNYINEMTEKKKIFKKYLNKISEDNINTPTFKKKTKVYIQDKRNRSLRNVLNSRQKQLENLEKDIQFKKNNIKVKKESLEIKKKRKMDIRTNSNNKNSKYTKKIDKRSFSKPDNGINIYKRNKKIKEAFGSDIIKKHLNGNKSQILDKIVNIKNKEIIEHNKKAEKDDEFNNLSIDSDEIILSDSQANIFTPSKKKIKEKNNKKKPLN